MYHLSGGEGLQVTERNGWQKDAGEPALSPDGRYLYYSKGVTPGQTFEYDKNPTAPSTRSSAETSPPGRGARPQPPREPAAQ
jgi:Tol biopolymer transport system component